MTDPFDRLNDAFGQVDPPDQWAAIEARAATPEMAEPVPGRTAPRHRRGWWLGAAAAVAALVAGIVVIGSRRAEAPVTPGDTIPPPAAAMPCTSEADLAAIVALLRLGPDSPADNRRDASSLVSIDAHVLLTAEATSLSREGEFVRMTLGTATYLRGEGPVDAVSWRVPPWDDPSRPDPLAERVDLAGVRVVAAVNSLSSSPVWSPPDDGLAVGCTGTNVPAIDVYRATSFRGSLTIDMIGDPSGTLLDRNLPACIGEPDLDLFLDRFGQSLATADWDAAESVAELVGRNPVIVLGTVGPGNEPLGTTLPLAVLEYVKGEPSTSAGDVISIDLRSATTATGDDFFMTAVLAFLTPADPPAEGRWVVDPDGLYVTCLSDRYETSPISAQAGGGGAIADLDLSSWAALVDQVRAHVAGPPIALPCRNNDDLAAVVTALPLPVFDHDAATDLDQLLGRVDTVFRATLASANRAVDGDVALHLTDVVPLAGEAAGVVVIEVESSWASDAGSDPLAAPLGFDGVEVVVFARRQPGLPTRWVPDVQGIFVACGGAATYVRPLVEPAAFLDHSSLDALADQVITATPADTGPWGRPCFDQPGTTESAAADPFGDRSFGAVAPEPGLTILYPFGPREPLYSDPVSAIARVPGGLLIRLLSSGPDGPDRIVAVVNDDGSVRWRRCIPDMYGWSAVIDDGVAHLEMTASGGSTEWWAFDLATGASTVDTGTPPEVADIETDWSPPATSFDIAGVDSTLRRLAPDGTEVWRRGDLFDPGGEGFRTGEPQQTDAGEVVLVRSCVGAPINSDSGPGDLPCPFALLGIDADDGHTVWQLDGLYGVALVADGYAIVTASGGDESWTDSSVLLDVGTGATVSGGVPDTPGAFYTECCGGYDYNRVESAGALAWTVAGDRLNVWFPADSPGPGVTVDLLGPAPAPIVTARLGMPVYDVAGCGVNCRHVVATGSGFPAGTIVRAECQTDRDGAWAPLGGPVDVSVGPDGSFGIMNLCADGRDDGHVKVIVATPSGDVESNVLVGG